MVDVIRPDVEAAVVGWFLANDIPASTRKGAALPCVTVERVGGPAMSVAHERPMVTIQAWASNSVVAGDLARNARRLIEVMDWPQVWYAHEVAGPVNYPDPTSNAARYQFTVELIAKVGAL